jgi:hypothetical protein
MARIDLVLDPGRNRRNGAEAVGLILTICPSRTWALTAHRPPQLWPQVLVTTVSPARGARRGAS